MLALIHATKVISQWPEGGWFELPDGTRASPAVDGWSRGGYSLATVQDADPVPAGKVSTGQTVQMVEGVPKYVNVLEDIPLEDVKARQQAQIDAAFTDATRVLTEGYPEAEQKSWAIQVMEAQMVSTEGAQTPWIDAAAVARGISRTDLAALIIAQDVAYRTYHGALSGTRQKLRDEIAAAQTVGDVLAVVWPQ